MYYLAEITDYDALVIKDSENKDFYEVFNNVFEVYNKLGETVLGVGFEKTKVITRAELGIVKYIDPADYSWEQSTVNYGSIIARDFCITDAGFNFRDTRPDIFSNETLVTLPMLIIKYLSKAVTSNFIYAIDDKLYVLADFQRLEGSSLCVCEYRVYNIKDRAKFDIAITKGVILCK